MAVTKKKGRLQTERFQALIGILEMLGAMILVKLGGPVVAGYFGGAVFFVFFLPYFFLRSASMVASRNLKTQISFQKYKAGNSFWCSAVIYEFLWVICISLLILLFGRRISIWLWKTPDIRYLLYISCVWLLLYAMIRLLESYIRGTGYINILKVCMIQRLILMFAGAFAGYFVFRKHGEIAGAILHNPNADSFYRAMGILGAGGIGLFISCLITFVFTFLVSRNYMERNKLHISTSLRERLEDMRKLATGEWTQTLFFFLYGALPMGALILTLLFAPSCAVAEGKLRMTGICLMILLPLAGLLVNIWDLLLIPVKKALAPNIRESDTKMIRIYLHGILRGYLAVFLALCMVLVLTIRHLFSFLLGAEVAASIEMSGVYLGCFIGFGISFVKVFYDIHRNFQNSFRQLMYVGIGFMLGLGVDLVLWKALHREDLLFSLSFLIPALVYFVCVYLDLKKQMRFRFVYMALAVEQLLLTLAPALVVYIIDRYAFTGWDSVSAGLMCAGIYLLIYLIVMVVVPVVSDSDVDSMPGASFVLWLRHFMMRG